MINVVNINANNEHVKTIVAKRCSVVLMKLLGCAKKSIVI